MCVCMQNVVEISQCRANFGQPTEYLMVFITVESFVGIASVVSMMQRFEYFACLA